MTVPLAANEEAQTLQTIEMFEVIAQSDPSDYVSLEILKEAYFKLGRPKDVVKTAKRIAEAYVRSGRLSSALLEYESIQQAFPHDPEVKAALAVIEEQATHISPAAPAETEAADKIPVASPGPSAGHGRSAPAEIDDGRLAMQKLLVDGKQISAADFNLCWSTPNLQEPPRQVSEPFLQILADKQLLPLDKSLKLVCERSRLSYLPLDKYDVDIDLARSFPRAVCQRWCVLPFDRLSKAILVATANPFNKQAALELEETNADNGTHYRFLWYLAAPAELLKILHKVFR
jgi:hypothetical protein